MTKQSFIDLARRNFFAASIDQLLDATRERQIALVIYAPLIPGAKPAACERFSICFWIALVSAKNVVAFDRHFPDFAGRQHIARIIEDRDADAGSLPDRTSLSRPGRQWVRGHLMSGLSHAVCFKHRRSEPLFESKH